MTTLRDTRKLFSPLQVGDMNLAHRIVMGPLTRARCPDHIPGVLNAEYYSQRSTPGGLIITEGTHPSIRAGNYHNAPGVYTQEQIIGWRLVTDAVHAKGGYIFCQLWHTGRVAVSVQMNGLPPLSASSTKLDSTNAFTTIGRVPNEMSEEMTLEDIEITIKDYVHAAKCAIEAGFDGVEVLAGNGYLPDQFLNSRTNLRADAYGGSLINRTRFPLQIVDAIATTIGSSKTGIRMSPWGTVHIPLDHDPVATFTYMCHELDKRGLAYVCLSHPRSDLFLGPAAKLRNLEIAVEQGDVAEKKAEDVSLDTMLTELRHTVKFVNGGYDGENCFHEVESGLVDAVMFSRTFIANPDLVERVRRGWPFAEVEDKTFYYVGGAKGYIDWSQYKDLKD